MFVFSIFRHLKCFISILLPSSCNVVVVERGGEGGRRGVRRRSGKGKRKRRLRRRRRVRRRRVRRRREQNAEIGPNE